MIVDPSDILCCAAPTCRAAQDAAAAAEAALRKERSTAKAAMDTWVQQQRNAMQEVRTRAEADAKAQVEQV